MARRRRSTATTAAPATTGPARWSYPSADALLAAAWAPASVTGAAYREQVMENARFSPGHYGASTREEATALARSGIAPDVARSAVAAPRTIMGTGRQARIFHSVAGGAPNVQRMLAGFPDCMRRVKRTSVLGPVVNMRICLSVSAVCDSHALTARGLAILSAVDALARSGHRVAITAYMATTGNGTHRAVCEFALKRADAPLDWQRVAFWLSHPAALRWHMFAWQDAVLPADIRRANGSGYGAPSSDPPTEPGTYHAGPCRSDSECYAVTAAGILAAVTTTTKGA